MNHVGGTDLSRDTYVENLDVAYFDEALTPATLRNLPPQRREVFSGTLYFPPIVPGSRR